jgi:hypothetical protein
MPLSDLQLRAAQENGLKSKGPASEQGKANSSRNSLRHGLLANTVVLEGESPNRFLDLLQVLKAEFGPETETERALVETMAVCRWRQMRLWGMEKAGLTQEIRKQSEQAGPAELDPATQTAMAFRALCDQTHAFEIMNRYETRFDRQYTRALERLTALRNRRGIARVA